MGYDLKHRPRTVMRIRSRPANVRLTYRTSSEEQLNMIRKWKATPVSSSKPKTSLISEDGRRSRDDTDAPVRSPDKPPRKPRRHTTGGGKQTIEDIRKAKELTTKMNNENTVVNEIGQEIDPNSTLGRKQLIAMLKQRYGPEIETFRNTGDISEKEKVRRDRQKERDRRYEQRMKQHNDFNTRESEHHNGLYHPTTTNSAVNYRPALNSHGGSDDSEEIDSSDPTPQGIRRMEVGHPRYESKMRYVQSSDDDTSGNRVDEKYQKQPIQTNQVQKPKEVVFLQYRDEVKRIQLPTTVSSLETMKALFVNAFPSKVAMPHFVEGLKSIYIKDMETGVYYQLEDVSEIVNRSFMKIQEHDTFSDTQSEMSAYNFRTQTLPNRGNQKYAESLQDYHLPSSTNERRRNSQESFRSENLHMVSKPIELEDDPYSYIDDDQTTVTNTSLTNQQKPQVEPKEESLSPYLKKKEQPKDPGQSLHDQLDDLSELLKTALNEEDKYHESVLTEAVDIKNPGKLNQHLIDNLQHKTETNAKKKVIPRHFQPTVIVMAQQESDRRTPDQGYYSTPPTSPLKKSIHDQSHRSVPPTTTTSTTSPPSSPQKKSSVTMTITSRKVEKPEEKPVYKNNFEATYSVPHKKQNAEESFISPPKQQNFSEHSNVIPTTHTVNKQDLHLPLQSVNSPKEPIYTPVYSPAKHVETIPTTTSKNTKEKDDYSSAIADELLSQLLDLEEEVKAQSSTSSSRSSSFKGNRRDSNASNGSRTSLNTAPQKVRIQQKETIDENQEQRSRGLSLPLQPYSPQRNNTTKQRTMTVDDPPVYATVNKPPRNEIRTKSHTTTTFDASPMTSPNDQVDNGDVFMPQSPLKSSPVITKKSPLLKRQPTGEICQKPSITAPDFLELDETARNCKRSLQTLRTDLNNLRKTQVENTRNFKADIQKKLLEFRKKASRVDEHLQQRLDMNNNFIFANEHPVRERRHRLTTDQLEYQKRKEDTKEKLAELESSMEMLRIDVVNKKRVDNPDDLDNVHDDLTLVTKALSELKNRYHGLHDMLNVVMTSETEIIQTEKQFIKDEPQTLEALISRCKTLSSTLYTLQKLASVQNVSQVNPNTSQLQRQTSVRR